MSAERGWIIEPQPASDPAAGWVAKHRDQGHHPYPAPTADNPECWECDCPDTAWTAIWRILTPEQIRQKYAHLKNRPMPDHIADRSGNPADDWEPPSQISGDTRLQIAPRYAAGRPRRS